MGVKMTKTKKDECIEKIKDVELYIRKEPVKSVAVAAGVGVGVGFLVGCLVCRR